MSKESRNYFKYFQLGGFGVAARDWAVAVLRVFHAFLSGRPDARHIVQKGAREVFGSHQKIPSSQHRSRHPLIATDEVRPADDGDTPSAVRE